MTKLKIESGFINVLKHSDNKVEFAIAEFVDNSIQSFEQNKKELKKIPGYKPTIDIDVGEDFIEIKDNCAGISKKEEKRAFSIAHANPDFKGVGTFGMGMKISACWFTDFWEVETKALGEKEQKKWTIDVNKIALDSDTDIGPKKTKNDGNPYTKILLKNCFPERIPRTTTITTLRNHLQDIYRWYLIDNILNIKYNGKLLQYTLPKIKEAPTYQDQKKELKGEEVAYRKWISQIPKIDLGKSKNGKDLWAKGYVYFKNKSAGKKQRGFAIFWKNRLVEGIEGNTWMPGGTWVGYR